MKFDIAMLCAYTKMSTVELAKSAGINEYHLRAVRAGRATMLADDILRLSEATGINVFDIEASKEHYKGLKRSKD